MNDQVLKEIQDFFAFLAGIITSFFEMLKGLFGGSDDTSAAE